MSKRQTLIEYLDERYDFTRLGVEGVLIYLIRGLSDYLEQELEEQINEQRKPDHLT